MASHSGCVVINYPLGHQTIHDQNFGRAQNEQIGKAAVNFMAYVSEKIKHVADWPEICTSMERFVALWVLTHLAFLKRYYSIFNDDSIDLTVYEKQIFALPLMRKYRMKYFLKTRMPGIHNFIVKSKSRFISRSQ